MRRSGTTRSLRHLRTRSGTVGSRWCAAERAAWWGPRLRVHEGSGHALPELLRRVYTEVGDGGFGPDSGLVSLRRGNRGPGDVIDWPSVHRERRQRYWAPPPSWLLLAYGGCSMEWHLSLTAVDSPVLLYDADAWKPDWGQDPHDGLCHAMPLRRWLSIWAEGGQVWDDVLAADG